MLNRNVSVYLIDPIYENQTLSSQVFPLGIGFLAAYLKKVFADRVDVEIFRFIPDLEKKIKREFPDILGATNYPWTCELSSLILRNFKQQNSNLLTVMGGPNISYNLNDRKNFLKNRPYIDFYVYGDGEVPLANIIDMFIKKHGEISEIKKKSIAGAACLGCNDSFSLCRSPYRHDDLEEIPSPYLEGIMDVFFDMRLFPVIQTTRGCPFSCVFCHEGNKKYNKLNCFSVDRVKAELEYISDRDKSYSLCITDSNFGMYSRDKEVCRHIRTIQDKKDWPKNIVVATGKNLDKVIESINVLKPGTVPIRVALQSTNHETLGIIKRKELDVRICGDFYNLPGNLHNKLDGQIIVPLPMETYNSHCEAYKYMISTGINRIQVNNLIMLNGTEIKTKSFIDKYSMKTRFRILSHNSGIYFNHKCFEYEEICVSTNTFSFKDYKKSRFLQLIMVIIHSMPFEPLLKYLRCEGYDVYEYVMTMEKNYKSASSELVDIFEKYKVYIEDELFESEEELKDYLSNDEVFSKVLENKIGNNLVQHYHSLLVTDYMVLFVDFLLDNLPGMISRVEIENLRDFMLLRYINLKDYSIDVRQIDKLFDYDVPQWFYGKDSKKLSEFKGKVGCIFYMSEDITREMRSKLGVFGNSDDGIANLLGRVGMDFLKRQVQHNRRVK